MDSLGGGAHEQCEVGFHKSRSPGVSLLQGEGTSIINAGDGKW